MTIVDSRAGPDKIRLLRDCLIFRSLDEAARQELAGRAYFKRFAAKEPIFQMGSPGQSMMAIASGVVRISAPMESGREIILADLPAGEVFGEVAMLDGKERSAGATALTNCELLVLERRDVVALIRHDPDAALRLLELLCGRLRRSEERMTEIAFLEVPARLARTLIRAAAEAAERSRVQPVKLSLAQGELARMIGSSRENVNRCLKEWQRHGLIDLKDGWLLVLDPQGLEAHAHR